MPRNSQGLYTPPLPPVRPGELIESVWANTTVDDIASALTGSLPRDGSAPMTGPLTLSNDPVTFSRQAVSKSYVDQFMAYASGMFVGAMTYAPITVEPPGWLLCDGRAVSRTTYATLFAAIGTMFGNGDGSTTFNLPPQSQRYLRGQGSGELIGQLLDGSFASHTHPTNDPGHSHAASQAVHSHATVAHSHGVNDPGHTHVAKDSLGGTGVIGGGAGFTLTDQPTGSSVTGISIQNAAPTTDQQQPAVTVGSSTTGVSVGATGGTETRPASIVCNLFIKASEDSAGTGVVTGITTSDPSCISIDNTNLVVPELVIHSNVAYGLAKLDQNVKLPVALLPAGIQTFLGTFDASGGQNPSEKYPSQTFSDGMTYLISAPGTITVYDPNTNVAAPTPVDLGWNLVWMQNQTQPVGWYYIESATVTAAIASQVAFQPAGTIAATNVQAAIEELDSETQTALATKATLGNANPLMDGVAAPGVAVNASRTDHVHPTDTTRAPTSATTAAGTSYVPGGGISATNVQAAIAELDNEKQATLGFTPVNKAGDTMTGALSLPQVSGNSNAGVFALDQIVTKTFDANGVGGWFLDIANFSGIIFLNIVSGPGGGAVSGWICGGGVTSKFADTGGWPADMPVQFNGSISGYTVLNNNASARDVSVTCIRTRNGA